MKRSRNGVCRFVPNGSSPSSPKCRSSGYRRAIPFRSHPPTNPNREPILHFEVCDAQTIDEGRRGGDRSPDGISVAAQCSRAILSSRVCAVNGGGRTANRCYLYHL